MRLNHSQRKELYKDCAIGAGWIFLNAGDGLISIPVYTDSKGMLLNENTGRPLLPLQFTVSNKKDTSETSVVEIKRAN